MEVVDAGWIWTEPHSKRLKVKLTVRKEVLNGVMVQQRVQCELVVRTMQVMIGGERGREGGWVGMWAIGVHVCVS